MEMSIQLKIGVIASAALLMLQLAIGMAAAQTPTPTPESLMLQGRLEALDTASRMARIGGQIFEYEPTALVYGLGKTPSKPERLGIGTQIQAVVQPPRKPGMPATITEFRTILE